MNKNIINGSLILYKTVHNVNEALKIMKINYTE